MPGEMAVVMNQGRYWVDRAVPAEHCRQNSNALVAPTMCSPASQTVKKNYLWLVLGWLWLEMWPLFGMCLEHHRVSVGRDACCRLQVSTMSFIKSSSGCEFLWNLNYFLHPSLCANSFISPAKYRQQFVLRCFVYSSCIASDVLSSDVFRHVFYQKKEMDSCIFW